MFIERYFHPVGQGAFYQELFFTREGENICTVFDCGSENKDKLYQVINNSSPNEIELLFISHFDNDHINGIQYLCENVNVNAVVLPHMDDEIKMYYLAKAISNDSSDDVIELILDPIGFFEKNSIRTQILVESQDRDNYEDERTINEIELWELSEGQNTIKSGTAITLNNKIWKWIPFYYNRKYTLSIKQEIEDTVKEYGGNIPIEATWLVNNLDKKLEKTKESLKAALKKIYTQYSKIIGNNSKADRSGSNINSLVIYSGPGRDNFYSNVENYQMLKKEIKISNRKIGCLFSGDYNAKADDSFNELCSFIKPYLHYIGVLQVPHHGSSNNYRNELVNGIPISLISFGELKRTHSHPDWTVYYDLLKNPTTEIIHVTDKDETAFMQYIEYRYCREQIFLCNLCRVCRC